MDEKINLILSKIGMLQNWTREMAALQENPYIKSFDITKMLEDLGGFVIGLRQDAEELAKIINPPEETEKASVEE